jgi:hypothetical protein
MLVFAISSNAYPDFVAKYHLDDIQGERDILKVLKRIFIEFNLAKMFDRF